MSARARPAAGRPGSGRVALLLCAGAVLVLGGCLQEAPSSLYRYVGPGGRPVFAQRLEDVPPELRARARRIELSRNAPEPAADAGLEALLARAELARAAERTPECRDAMRQSSQISLVRRSLLVAMGVVVVLLLGATPWALRRVPQWGKILALAVPLLGALAAFVFLGVRSAEQVAAARRMAARLNCLSERGLLPDAKSVVPGKPLGR